MDDNKNTYFAARSPEQAAHALLDKSSSFFKAMETNAYIEKLQQMWNAYYGAYASDSESGHRITFTGDQGELVQLPINHFRNLARNMYNMVTANRPIMEAKAVNTDYKSLSQTYLANGILDYYMRQKKLELCLKKAVEMSIVIGAGYVKLAWNATAGKTHDADPETGEFTHEGELEFSNLSPLDVIFDGTKETWEDHEWLMARTYINKYNLMAKYPEHSEKISKMSSKNSPENSRFTVFSNDTTDDIPVYEFYHKVTEAMPEGRYMLFVDVDVVLLDMSLPYRQIPIYRIVPAEIMGTSYGYSDMFDVFPIQEAINASMSAIMTNQNAFAVQNLYVPRGADIDVTTLGEGMQIIEANAKPERIDLLGTPPEVFKFVNDLVAAAETISGVNSVARGKPDASLQSGTALALVQSMALQFLSGLQQSYVMLIEDVGTSLLDILKDFSKTPKMIALVGKNNRSYLQEVTGESIIDVQRVIVDVGNALSRSIAGRVQIADQLAQMKLLKNPQQYFQVLETGRIDAMFEGDMSELLLVKRENEKMLDGQTVPVALLDAHRMHILEHKSLIADPDLRKDAGLLKNVQDHILEHINILRSADPDLLQLIGEQPLNPPMTAGAPVMPPGPMANKEVIGNSPIPGMQQAPNPSQAMADAGMPNMPKVDSSLLPNPDLQVPMGNLK